MQVLIEQSNNTENQQIDQGQHNKNTNIQEDILDDQKNKRKVRNFKINSKRNLLKKYQSNNFNDPIYAGLEDQVFNKQQHNFGPWIGNQHLGKSPSRQFINRPVIIVQRQRPTLQNYNHSPNSQQYINFRNWQSTLRTHYLPSSEENRYQIRYREASTQRNSLPAINFNTNERGQERKLQYIQNMRLSSTEMLKTYGSQEIKSSKLKKFNKNVSQNKLTHVFKGKYALNIPFVPLECQKVDSPRKLSKVVYNYCYDDQSLSAKLNPEISKFVQTNLRAQMMEKLKKQLKKGTRKENYKNSSSKKLIGLHYKGKF